LSVTTLQYGNYSLELQQRPTRRNHGDDTAFEFSQPLDRARGLVPSRLMNAAEAARYLGYDSVEVLKNIPVPPIRLTSVGVGRGPRYDRHAIDSWLDELSGLKHPTASTASDNDDAQRQFEAWRRDCEARRH
jgi:hypothetical protein